MGDSEGSLDFHSEYEREEGEGEEVREEEMSRVDTENSFVSPRKVAVKTFAKKPTSLLTRPLAIGGRAPQTSTHSSTSSSSYSSAKVPSSSSAKASSSSDHAHARVSSPPKKRRKENVNASPPPRPPPKRLASLKSTLTMSEETFDSVELGSYDCGTSMEVDERREGDIVFTDGEDSNSLGGQVSAVPSAASSSLSSSFSLSSSTSGWISSKTSAAFKNAKDSRGREQRTNERKSTAPIIMEEEGEGEEEEEGEEEGESGEKGRENEEEIDEEREGEEEEGGKVSPPSTKAVDLRKRTSYQTTTKSAPSNRATPLKGILKKNPKEEAALSDGDGGGEVELEELTKEREKAKNEKGLPKKGTQSASNDKEVSTHKSDRTEKSIPPISKTLAPSPPLSTPLPRRPSEKTPSHQKVTQKREAPAAAPEMEAPAKGELAPAKGPQFKGRKMEEEEEEKEKEEIEEGGGRLVSDMDRLEDDLSIDDEDEMERENLVRAMKGSDKPLKPNASKVKAMSTKNMTENLKEKEKEKEKKKEKEKLKEKEKDAQNPKEKLLEVFSKERGEGNVAAVGGGFSEGGRCFTA